jgi:hypothetical protein
MVRGWEQIHVPRYMNLRAPQKQEPSKPAEVTTAEVRL